MSQRLWHWYPLKSIRTMLSTRRPPVNRYNMLYVQKCADDVECECSSMGCQRCAQSKQCCGGRECEGSTGVLQQLALEQGESSPTCLTRACHDLLGRQELARGGVSSAKCLEAHKCSALGNDHSVFHGCCQVLCHRGALLWNASQDAPSEAIARSLLLLLG